MLRAVCPIPAPSLNEDERVDFILSFLRAEGIASAFEDEAKNVIIPYNDTGDNELDVFAAHTDVVFPDTSPLPFREEGDFIHSPGCGDDTASFVALLMYAVHFFKEKPKTERGVLFVCNAAEEGLGNLKGTRKLFDTYRGRIRSFTTFDECLGKGIVDTAVGSERYLIKVKTKGGHSFKDFGNRNAIAAISEIIAKFYEQDVSLEGRTTYNVGTISGGTSVNTIAEYAECTYEFRSTSKAALEKISKEVHRTCVTLEWNADDIAAVYATRFRPGEEPCEDISTVSDAFLNDRPAGQGFVYRADKVFAGEKEIGLSSGRIISYTYNSMISLGFIAPEYAAEGTELAVLWGTPGTRQMKIRAKVVRFPYNSDYIRNENKDVEEIPHYTAK